MPTFMFFRNKTKIDTLRGADAGSLEEKIRKWYGSGDENEDESVVKGQVSKLDLLHVSQVVWRYQNCSVLYCVLKLCTVISTVRWAVLTVLWIGFCLTGPISLCLDSFVLCSCVVLSYCMCCIIVGWSWWDWSLILGPSFSALTLLVGSFYL